jgi:hypothetical protein
MSFFAGRSGSSFSSAICITVPLSDNRTWCAFS